MCTQRSARYAFVTKKGCTTLLSAPLPAYSPATKPEVLAWPRTKRSNCRQPSVRARRSKLSGKLTHLPVSVSPGSLVRD